MSDPYVEHEARQRPDKRIESDEMTAFDRLLLPPSGRKSRQSDPVLACPEVGINGDCQCRGTGVSHAL